MDKASRDEAEILRAMESEDAASWLIATYPLGGQALRLVRHRSWLKADQDRLADHYLASMPFAASWPYEALLSVMSLKRFLRFAEAHFPEEPPRADLAMYYLGSALRAAAKTENDASLVTSFLASHQTG